MRRFGSGAGLLTLLASGVPLGRLFSPRRAMAAPGGGLLVGNVNSPGPDGAVIYTDPLSGDPAIVVPGATSGYVAYDAVCTHAGCTVAYDPDRRLLTCPCHGSSFDPAHAGRVVTGPAADPLARLAIHVETNGDIYALDGEPATVTPTAPPTPAPTPRRKKKRKKKPAPNPTPTPTRTPVKTKHRKKRKKHRA